MQKEIVNEISFVSSYSYDWENRLSSITKFNGFSGDIVKQNLNYDSLGRLNNIRILENSISVVNTTLDYKASNTGTGTITTNVLSQWNNTYGGNTTSYYYKYDANGNIVEISPDSIFSNDNGVRYSYDKLNQLVRVDDKDNGESWTYTYDLGGNIVSKSRYAYTRGTLGTALQTINYGYTDSSWADLLTSYNGKSLTYDQIGNLKSDGTWTYTWEHGRQLLSMQTASTGWNFDYDATGQRTSKTNGTLTYHYIYDDIQLKYLKVTQNSSTVCEMYFEYGQTGLVAIQYISSSLTDKYYVLTNAQGDVVGLVDGSGALVVKYNYDAWGKLKSMTGSLASTVGTYNPIRYRGYVYDTETQLYYLNTRYYNPDVGRFINADGYASTGDELLGSNMFAYCGNNPVNCVDPTGEFAITTLLVGALVGSAVSFVSSVVSQSITGDHEINWGVVALDTIIGGVSGALGASGISQVVSMIAGGVLNAVGSVGSDLIESNGDWNAVDVDKAFKMTQMGVLLGKFTGAGTQNTTAMVEAINEGSSWGSKAFLVSAQEAALRPNSGLVAQTMYENMSRAITMYSIKGMVKLSEASVISIFIGNCVGE